MSLILDALRKADHDRKVDDNPSSIDEIYNNDAHEETKNKPTLILLAIVALVLALFAIFMVSLFTKQSDNATVPITSKPTTQNRLNATTIESSPVILAEDKIATSQTENNQNKGQQDSTKNIITSSTGVSVESLKQAQRSKQYSNNKKSAAGQEATSNTSEKIADLYQERSSQVTSTQAPKIEASSDNNATPHSENTLSTNSDSDNTLAFYVNIPLIKELLASEQENIPTMMYTEHNFASSGRSSVIINGKRFYENATIASGIRIERILIDGLLLKQNQQSFKMRARNSWLNF